MGWSTQGMLNPRDGRTPPASHLGGVIGRRAGERRHDLPTAAGGPVRGRQRRVGDQLRFETGCEASCAGSDSATDAPPPR
jgi:hypothetical protein